MDYKKIPGFLKKSSVGTIPHHVTNHTNYTIPNKLFDYMYYGLPVIASGCRPIARILQKEGCGMNFPCQKPLRAKRGNLMQLESITWRLPRCFAPLEELKHKLLILFVTAQRGEVLAMTTHQRFPNY